MNVEEILSRFNWIDILVVTVLFRSTYIGVKKGFVIELFKNIGIIFTCFFTLHYYVRLGNFLADKTPVAQTTCWLFSYLVISFLILLISTLARHSFLRIIKIETVELLRWLGGGVLGLARGGILASIICLFFVISNVTYLKGSVRQSYSGEKIINIAPNTYRFIFDNLVTKFAPEAELNHTLFEKMEE
jgi:uncharacterized membrane protein required for colicin V production